MSRRLGAVLCAGAVLISGCASSGGPVSDANACALLTRDEVAQALGGGSVTALPYAAGEGATGCTWAQDAGSLSVGLVHSVEPTTVAGMKATIRGPADSATTRPGVGDGAKVTMTGLSVLVGESVFTLSTPGESVEEVLAPAVIARLR